MKTREETIAYNLRTRREALGLSQEKLAELADVSWITIHRIESGKRIGTKLSQIAKAVGCTKEDLAKSHEDPKENSSNDLLTLIEAWKRAGRFSRELALGILQSDESEATEEIIPASSSGSKK